MPQLNKGGKFVFGLSEISSKYTIQIPEPALRMYGVANDDKIIIFTGSKITGGFCVTSKKLLSQSKLKHILDECPELSTYSINEGDFIRYKGRGYSWLFISSSGIVQLTKGSMEYLNLKVGHQLMCIKSSDIAFTMGAEGPLMDKVHNYKGTIDLY